MGISHPFPALEEAVEAPSRREPLGAEVAQVPLAHEVGRVAHLLQVLRQDGELGRQAPRLLGEDLGRISKRETLANFARLGSPSFSTRFGSFVDERSSLGANSKHGCFPLGRRFENTHVEATLNHSFPAPGKTWPCWSPRRWGDRPVIRAPRAGVQLKAL